MLPAEARQARAIGRHLEFANECCLTVRPGTEPQLRRCFSGAPPERPIPQFYEIFNPSRISSFVLKLQVVDILTSIHTLGIPHSPALIPIQALLTTIHCPSTPHSTPLISNHKLTSKPGSSLDKVVSRRICMIYGGV